MARSFKTFLSYLLVAVLAGGIFFSAGYFYGNGSLSIPALTLVEDDEAAEENASAAAEEYETVTVSVDMNYTETSFETYAVESVLASDEEAEQYAYYEMLSSTQQAVYETLCEAIESAAESVSLDTQIGAAKLIQVMEAVLYDHPEYFWMEGSFSYASDRSGVVRTVRFMYNDLADDLEENIEIFEEAVAELVLQASACSTDYEMEKAVHDLILSEVSYASDADYNQTAWSALVGRETVCAGYAKAFQCVMNELGITTYYVVGTSMNQGHAWNIVCLDGEYYNVDLTWDDQRSISYAYFNLTDEEFASTHTRTGLSVYLPSCGGSAYGSLEETDEEEEFILPSELEELMENGQVTEQPPMQDSTQGMQEMPTQEPVQEMQQMPARDPMQQMQESSQAPAGQMQQMPSQAGQPGMGGQNTMPGNPGGMR